MVIVLISMIGISVGIATLILIWEKNERIFLGQMEYFGGNMESNIFLLFSVGDN